MSLLDTVIALTMSGVMTMACLSMMMTSTAAADVARQDTIAYQAARQVLENVRQYKAAKIDAGTYTTASVFGPVPQLAMLNHASAALSVSTWHGSVKLLVVTVTWKRGGRGQDRAQSITALLSPKGVAP